MNEDRHLQVAALAGAPECSKVLHEDLLTVHEGQFCDKHLLPKGWWVNDYSPTENLIEIEDTNKGDRFWVKSEAFFYFNFQPGQQYLLIKKGAKNIKDIAFHQKMVFDRFDALTYRKRCYVLVVFKELITDQEAMPA